MSFTSLTKSARSESSSGAYLQVRTISVYLWILSMNYGASLGSTSWFCTARLISSRTRRFGFLSFVILWASANAFLVSLRPRHPCCLGRSNLFDRINKSHSNETGLSRFCTRRYSFTSQELNYDDFAFVSDGAKPPELEHSRFFCSVSCVEVSVAKSRFRLLVFQSRLDCL
jgi:hypothetical protein